jgi:hypothetical protein
MWLIVIVGVALLFRATAHAAYQPSGKSLLGVRRLDRESDLAAVRILELRIVPDRSGGAAVATLQRSLA